MDGRQTTCISEKTLLCIDVSVQVKVSQLRRRTKAQLLEQLRDNKRELAALRVAQVTGGAPNKLAKMCAPAIPPWLLPGSATVCI